MQDGVTSGAKISTNCHMSSCMQVYTSKNSASTTHYMYMYV